MGFIRWEEIIFPHPESSVEAFKKILIEKYAFKEKQFKTEGMVISTKVQEERKNIK